MFGRALGPALFVLTLAAACGFPRPADRCEGTCAVYAIDRSLAGTDSHLALYGVFEQGAVVAFPGGINLTLEVQGDGRAVIQVPAEATAGDLTITTSQGPSHPVPFRRPTFELGLQPFAPANDQGDVARVHNNYNTVRIGATATAIGSHVYQIGGVVSSTLTNEVVASLAGADGSLGEQIVVGHLTTARAYHSAVVVANRWLYVIAGLSAGDTIERAEIDADGNLGPFSVLPVKLSGGTREHASAVIGHYIYVFGGRTDASEINGIYRARIGDNGDLDPFEEVGGQPFLQARSSFGLAISGNRLFVIGGLHDGQPIDTIETAEIFADGSIGDFAMAGKLVEPRAHHGCVVLGDDVYVLGGFGLPGTLQTVERAPIVDQSTLTFTSPQTLQLIVPRQDAGYVIVGNYLYAIGGYQMQGSTVNALFDPERASIIETGALETFAMAPVQLVEPRSGALTVVLGNHLYVIGGANGSALSTIDHATIRPDGTLTNFETYGNGLYAKRFGAAAIIEGNTLYVVGGRSAANTQLDSIEAATIGADGTLGTFGMTTAKLTTARDHFAVLAHGSIAYVLGGSTTGNSVTATIENAVLNPGQGFTGLTPYTNSTIVDPRTHFAGVVFGRYYYVLTGFDGTTYRGIARATLSAGLGFETAFTGYATNLTNKRHGYAAVVTGNALYVIGGDNPGVSQTAVEIAESSPQGNIGPFSVSPTVALNIARSDSDGLVIGNFVYVIGGARNGSSLQTIEVSTVH